MLDQSSVNSKNHPSMVKCHCELTTQCTQESILKSKSSLRKVASVFIYSCYTVGTPEFENGVSSGRHTSTNSNLMGSPMGLVLWRKKSEGK